MTTAYLGTVHSHATHPLWNPRAIVAWSIPFTPAFGAYLQMRNWEALGESDYAAESRDWFIAALVVIGAYIAANAILASGTLTALAANVLMGLFYVAWYLVSAKGQVEYVEQTFDEEYPHQPWAIAIAFGVIALAILVAVAAMLGSI